jgi:hypothetical protein
MELVKRCGCQEDCGAVQEVAVGADACTPSAQSTECSEQCTIMAYVAAVVVFVVVEKTAA